MIMRHFVVSLRAASSSSLILDAIVSDDAALGLGGDDELLAREREGVIEGESQKNDFVSAAGHWPFSPKKKRTSQKIIQIPVSIYKIYNIYIF